MYRPPPPPTHLTATQGSLYIGGAVLANKADRLSLSGPLSTYKRGRELKAETETARESKRNNKEANLEPDANDSSRTDKTKHKEAGERIPPRKPQFLSKQ